MNDANNKLLLSEVIGAMSYALDLTEGQPPGHCIRSCWIAMHIGQQMLLSLDQLWELYYTVLLKDAGCSSNAARLCELYGSDDRKAKREYKSVDNHDIVQVVRFVFQHTRVDQSFKERISRILYLATHGEKLAGELVKTRCERGAEIASQLGFNENVAQAIRFLDEHWNGKGRPLRLKGEHIPLYSRIALLSQVVDVFYHIGGVEAVQTELRIRRGVWFDPDVVDAFYNVSKSYNFWGGLKSKSIDEDVRQLEPESRLIYVDEDRLDNIAEAFSQVVDAKSPYTFGHSTRVAKFAAAIGKHLELSPDRCRLLYRAALLHDIGKLGVSNTILDKPDRLTSDEWLQVKNHAGYTENILNHLSPFSELAFIAGAHHERLNGNGYPKGLKAEQIPIETRIITVCDIFDALTADRPYRNAIPLAQALEIMEKQRGTALDSKCLDSLIKLTPSLLESTSNQKVA